MSTDITSFPIVHTKICSSSPEEVEDRILQVVVERRIRLIDLYRDYDKLRTGFVSPNQFHSVLTTLVPIKLEPEEVELLKRKYQTKPGDDRVNYQAFCNNTSSLETKMLRENRPAYRKQVAPVVDYRDMSNPVARVLLSIQGQLTRSMTLMKPHFADYDPHNMGRITAAQFLGALTICGIQVDDKDRKLLLETYKDPQDPEILYLNFCDDLQASGQANNIGSDYAADPPFLDPIKPIERPSANKIESALEFDKILEKVRLKVLQERMRPIDFFKDFDKLRTGWITRHHFLTCLSMAKFDHLLNTREKEVIADQYAGPEGKIAYRRFWDDVEEVFTVTGLEKDPSRQVKDSYEIVDPHQRHNCSTLSPEREEMVDKIMKKLNVLAVKRRVLFGPFFYDFDKNRTGVISKAQFRSVLALLGFDLTDTELGILCEKYRDATHPTLVSYMRFSEHLDPDSFQKFQHQDKPTDSQPTFGTGDMSATGFGATLAKPQSTFEDLLVSIQHRVYIQRIRLDEFFRDNDRLKTGRIPDHQFRAALDRSTFRFSDGEFELLREHYVDSKDPRKMRWMDFCSDINSIFTKSGLESDPLGVPTGTETLLTRVQEMTAVAELPFTLEPVVTAIATKVKMKRIHIKPFFKEFDPHNCGRVSKKNFRQSMALIGIELPEQQVLALLDHYVDPRYGDFDYFRFSKDVDRPDESPELHSGVALPPAKERQKSLRPQTPSPEVTDVIAKLQVTLVNVRPRDYFRDHDGLRRGYVSESLFVSLVDSLHFGLKPKEVNVLTEHYRNREDPGKINYDPMCDDIDAAQYVKGLETCPTGAGAMPAPQKTIQAVATLSEAEEVQVGKILKQIQVVAIQKRLILEQYMKDYDRANKGKVTRAQFLKCLRFLGFDFNEEEQRLLSTKFAEGIDVNYRTFCRGVELQ